MIKAVGAAADQGADLDELLRIGNKVNSVTRTMGMALTSCTPPAKGSPLFELGDDEMEMGVGIHGEPGRRREKLASANEIVDELLEAVVSDLPFGAGDDVALMINGLGGTPISNTYSSAPRPARYVLLVMSIVGAAALFSARTQPDANPRSGDVDLDRQEFAGSNSRVGFGQQCDVGAVPLQRQALLARIEHHLVAAEDVAFGRGAEDERSRVPRRCAASAGPARRRRETPRLATTRTGCAAGRPSRFPGSRRPNGRGSSSNLAAGR